MPIRYIPFFPDPIRGQALLDNFKRTLRYSGSENAERLIRRGMPFYEMETVESVGEQKSRMKAEDTGRTPLSLVTDNLVIRGECLAACAALRDVGRTVDLVYIDPPFASGADYAKKIYLRRNPKIAEELATAEQTLNTEDFAAFEEKMYGDIWEKEKYLNWMYTNLLAIKSVMSDFASIYVHLDWHIGHYVKVLMDEIFGEENFRNEITWVRTASHNDSTMNFSRVKDSLFFYSKDINLTFNRLFSPYSKEYIEEEWNKSPSGRLYKVENMLDPQNRMEAYNFHGTVARWRTTPEKFEALWNAPQTDIPNSHGRIKIGKDGAPIKRCRIVFLDELPGVPISDMWDDIPYVAGRARESVDYATQKPEALLERIINASSDAGMTVADFFGGSGVMAAVAARLGRKFIHVDIGVNSTQTTRDRLLALGALFSVCEIKDGVSLYRNPVQTMDKLKSLIPGLRNEDSVDEFWEGAIHDSRLGLVPVYLPNLMDSASRILDEPLLFRIIHQAIPELPSEVKKVIVYYIQAEDLVALEKFIKGQKVTTVEIELRDLKDVLDDVVVNDMATWKLEENATGDLWNPWKLTIERFSSDRVLQKIDEYNQRGMANPSKRGFTPLHISEEGLETLEAVAVDCTSADGPFHADRDLRIDKFGYIILEGHKNNVFWDGTLSLPAKPLRIRFRNICGDETIVLTE